LSKRRNQESDDDSGGDIDGEDPMLFGLEDYDEKTCSLNFLPGEDLADCLDEQ
tara:strand:+ start:95 stop:253 length:159 start_codon:yes stop_codon:yes gene_type:complete